MKKLYIVKIHVPIVGKNKIGKERFGDEVFNNQL